MAQKYDWRALENWMPHSSLDVSRHSYGQVPTDTTVQLLGLPSKQQRVQRQPHCARRGGGGAGGVRGWHCS
jgi:hypothetical protein